MSLVHFYSLDTLCEMCIYKGMDLKDYLAENGITESAFAEKIGVDQSTINRLKNGQLPSLATMKAIARETGGAVRADDFFGL